MDVDKLTTEEKIINASFNVLINEGISKVTTKKIAEYANVSEVTIFRKFKTKQNLLNSVQEYYLDKITSRINKIFEFDENISIEKYLKRIFYDFINLSDEELNIIKIFLEEVFYVQNNKKAIPKISEVILEKLTDFFNLQIKLKRIRCVNAKLLAMKIYGIIFESVILWKVYGKRPDKDVNYYFDDFLDILFNGIKSKEGM